MTDTQSMWVICASGINQNDRNIVITCYISQKC